MKRLLIVTLLVAGCGGATSSPLVTSPVTTSIPTGSADAASPAAASTPNASIAATPIDPALVTGFTAAYTSLTRALPRSPDLSDPNDWVAAQVLLAKQAEAYDAFARDLEAIRFPETVVLNGESQDLGRDSSALIGWSKEIAIAVRQIAAAASFEAAMEDTVEFEGSSYPMRSFLQDATGEWAASLNLTAADLGVDISQL